MDLDREAWVWGREMKPKFDAAKEDFDIGIKYGIWFSIPIVFLVIIFL